MDVNQQKSVGQTCMHHEYAVVIIHEDTTLHKVCAGAGHDPLPRSLFRNHCLVQKFHVHWVGFSTQEPHPLDPNKGPARSRIALEHASGMELLQLEKRVQQENM